MIHGLPRHTLERFRVLATKRLGLELGGDRLEQLGDALVKRQLALGERSVSDYIDRFESASDAEVGALAELLTITETYFFRADEHFRVLSEVVVDAARKRGRRLRLLSAGCASGEEAYSLAITLYDSLPDFESWDIRIDAVDLNPAMLLRADQARYSAWSLRATSEQLKSRYFAQIGREFQLSTRIRRMVNFERRNLADGSPEFWDGLACDAIFCRNVLMYFRNDAARGIVSRFERALLPGGFLFLGHAETLRGLSQDYHLCHGHEAFFYQRRPYDFAAPYSTHSPEHQETLERTPQQPAATDDDISWVDAIQGASQRIEQLSERRDTPSRAEQAPSLDLGKVLAFVHEERFGDALELLRALPEAQQKDGDVLLLIAVILTNKGARSEAEAACRRLLEVDELNAGAHYLLALCREHESDDAAAAECDKAAIYLDPSFAMPHLHLGLLARRGRDFALARRELSQALALLPREDASRLVLFGGGFSRQTLLTLCESELGQLGAQA